MRVSTHGDWDGWIDYFLAGVAVQAKEAADLADRLIALQTRYRHELQASRVPANVLGLVDCLFLNPLVSTARAERVLGVSAPTARKAIRRLEDAGILREATGRDWRRVHQADEVLELLRS